ncbi:MAG TPA: tat pathway signal sequence [Actinophytocola sp.]|uniref:tat pathway signal sequence n=1 Tax=Actinophytocola sp. TaxID=1872138 RepID=UPI002DB957E0|nr:tat pathway signal sequence [Actinophytocola sp.]HEU5473971.1 tat pathway signal sequence [Actinophytocola sp.]
MSPAGRCARVLIAAAVLVAAAGCGSAPSGEMSPAHLVLNPASSSHTTPPPVSAGPPVASASTPPPAPPPAAECPLPQSGFDCDFQRRFASAEAYLAKRPGTVGIVVHDRKTGAVWHNGHAGDPTWTASTIKLAMTVNLLLRDRAGEIALTVEDRGLIHAMLNSSDDNAADTLWFRYAGADHMAFNNAFSGYGMTSLAPQRGFADFYPYWGFQKCTADDLDRLMSYVLGELPADLRDYVVGELRGVAPNQQWGVWAAGPAARPGNKNGWSSEQGGWVMNTVGFAGPAERYVFAAMNNLRGKGGYDAGKATVSEIARIILAGRA